MTRIGAIDTLSPGQVQHDATCATQPRVILVDGRVMQDSYHGIGRYTFELLLELSRHDVRLIVLYSPIKGRLDISELINRSNVLAIASRIRVASLRSQWVLSRAAMVFRPDVVFVPYHLSTPLLHGRVPVVSVMHDCIFERNAAANGRTAFSLAYSAFSRLAVRSATALAVPSESSRGDIRRFYGLNLPAEAVLPHGVGAQFFSFTDRSSSIGVNAHLPKRYVLHVGARRPHKNQRILVKALEELRTRHPDLGLVLVGQPDPRVPDEVSELVRTLGLSGCVYEYTCANDELLKVLYANAAVFAYPSLVEGFGIPLLEAMAAGVPVVASDADAVVETVGDAALIVPASMTERWVEALDQVLSNPQLAQRLRQRGWAVAANHTWAKSAERTLTLLTDVASVGKKGRKHSA
ncbi:MAG: glycosyltransferase family 4 protein [Streptosporangiaceae bacterium]